MANILHGGGAAAGEQPDLPHGRGAAGAPGDAGAAARGRKGARAAGREVNGARAMAGGAQDSGRWRALRYGKDA